MFGSGWKGKAGGVLLALVGVFEAVVAVKDGADVMPGLSKIAAGLGIFGVRDAIKKE